MEYHLEVRNNSGDTQWRVMTKKVNAHPASRDLKLGERFKLERPTLSYAGPNHKTTNDTVCAALQSPENSSKHKAKIKAAEDDEFVKYMSNLPSYLEKRDNPNDAPFNIGVLDWGRLEKWKQKSKRISNRSRDYSPSSTNDSTCFPVDVSSSKSSQGHICSPAQQSSQHPTLQSYLKPSLPKVALGGVSSSLGTSGKFPDPKASQTGSSYGHENYAEKDEPVPNYQSEGKQEENVEKDHEPEIIEKMNLSSYFSNNEVTTSGREGISRTGDSEITYKLNKAANSNSDYKLNKAANSNSDILNCNFLEGNRKVVLLVPKGSSQKSSGVASRRDDSVGVMDGRSKEVGRGICCTEVAQHTDLSDSPHSPLLTRHDGKQRQRSQRPVNAQSRNKFLDASDSQCCAKTHFNKSTGQDLPENRSAAPPCLTEIKPVFSAPLEAVKARTFSPTSRLSFSMSIVGKHSNPTTLDSSSLCINAPKNSRSADSICTDSSKGERLSATTREKSSPLRRLLDPLLKPKESNSHRCASPLRKLSKSRNSEAGWSSMSEADAFRDHSAKVKHDSTCPKSIRRSNYPEHGTGKVQSLLKVTIKNGLPLFTFASENYKEILAATMKKLSTLEESKNSYLYTFFTFLEMKKKSWIHPGDKSKSHDYMPNVVAQMEVSEFPSLTGGHVKECVLFAVDLRQAENGSSHLKPNDELAAIVLNSTNKRSGNSNQDELRSCDYSGTTVILPNGVHTLPSKGEPSSLVKRWKSGGICDCGGWDLGCKLRVLSEQKHFKGLTQTNSCSIDHFQLFNEGEVQGKQPVFNLTKFRNGIYSVEFDSSISILQAFSTCMALVDSKEPHFYFGRRSSKESEIVQSDCNKVLAQVPARYVSYPPKSPAERV